MSREETDADRALTWVKALRERANSQTGIPDDAKLADELWAATEFAKASGIRWPAIERAYHAERKRVHKERAGNAAIDQDEVVFRAKIIAAINHLIKAGVDEKDARKDVAGYAGVDAEKAARWHKENWDAKPPEHSNAGGNIVYVVRLDYQIEKYMLELERKHNSLTPLEAVVDLFKP
ncbi:hypothetical protein D1823_18115 [Ruegeria sp. AD91A]|uniref:hypothetical protein n=1 Tax=Ruegeria sp. AD91A TaxID=2293862 RepID=UPI000E4B69C9|nr:hypothetical protein [Ruegeria sp. AD91A]AXT28302.1 hypothetical protein D1823_18115 [Ruegeria sp. AD91A]